MGDPVNPRETFTTEEGVLANMWAIEALVELLERKGLCIKQEVHDLIAELRLRHGELSGKVIVPGLPATTKDEQYLIDHLLTVIEAVGLQPAESKELLRGVSLIIDHRERTRQRLS